MSADIAVSDEVKRLVEDILNKNGFKPTSKITYGIGSELGDGFMSKTYAVDIEDEDKKESLHLFLKCAINVKFPGGVFFEQIYINEIYFYEVIAPAFAEFLKEKGITGGFQNVPRCYGSMEDKILALENLRYSGYELCDKELVGNRQHIELVFKTYAKFHAISFAYKDQKREEYNKIAEGMGNLLDGMTEEFDKQRLEAARNAFNDFFAQLHPKKDKFILDQSQYMTEKLIEDAADLGKHKCENAVILQGDCWCNNMMFKYKEGKADPYDVMLVDWQIIRADSPVFDLCYFFYTAAASSKPMLRQLDDFLEIYHDELSAQMRKMGSDAEVIYPLPVLKTEWKQYSKYGFSMAFLILRAMLSDKDKDNVPNFEEVDVMSAMSETGFSLNEREVELVNRLRNLAQHFLLNEFV